MLSHAAGTPVTMHFLGKSLEEWIGTGKVSDERIFDQKDTMKTVLVTGAGGYIGRHVVQVLADMGVSVVSLDSGCGSIDGATRHIAADILSPDFRVMDHFDKMPDACLHLAWRNGFNHSDPSHMTDVSGHFSFIRSLIDSGLPQIAIMGSMHEVGYWEGSIDEDTPCNPQSLYGVAKDALRRSVFLYSEGKATAIQWLRGFYIYGDDEGSQSIFGKLLRAASSGETLFPFTSGRNKYDFLSIEELAYQIAMCIMQDETTGIVNCCSGRPVSLATQVEDFIASHNLNISLEYGVYPDRPYDSPAVWGDASKIQAILQSHNATC